MSLVGTLYFHEFAVLLFLTSVLTLTVSSGTIAENDINREPVISNRHESLQEATQLSTVPASQPPNTNSTSNTNPIRVAAEGGQLYFKPESALSRDKQNLSREIANTQQLNVTEHRNVTRTPEKTKIVPRKGADQSAFTAEVESTSLDKAVNDSATKPVFEPAVATESTKAHQQTSKVSTDTPSVNSSDVQLNVTINNKEHVLPVTNEPENKIPVSETSKHTHKPKPTLTIGGPDKDKPVRITPTKSTLTGAPRKIDYIVPIVITVVALPILAAAAVVMYRRGRDCWDKRHYRRMDFLIDGMYND